MWTENFSKVMNVIVMEIKCNGQLLTNGKKKQ